MSEVKEEAAAAPALEPFTLSQLLLYFAKLGATGFGGPIALAGYMQRDLVEKRRWISSQDYKEGLALSQLAPGPLATQLAMYLGWVKSRTLGATLVGFVFVLPSFLMVIGLSALYVRFGGLSWMQGLFYGIGAAVIAIIVRSAFKLAKLTLGKDWILWFLFLVNAAVTGITRSEKWWVFLLSGLVALILKYPRLRATPAALVAIPPWLITGIHGPATSGTLLKILLFFTEAGAFVFGSGLAIVPFLYGGVVTQYQWLTERQFLDAVAVGMITPGPVVITSAFIGYLVAGPTGSTAAAAGVFLPCYLMVIIFAPFFSKFAKNPYLKAVVDGVTAAATGAIAGAAYVLARQALIDWKTVAISVVTVVVLFTVKKFPEMILILLAGGVGLLLR